MAWLVVGDLRVQEVVRSGGRVSYTVVDERCQTVAVADGFLRSCRAGTDRTYAYLLVDHLRWLRMAGLEPAAVTLRDLQHYMAAVGAEHRGPFGPPWRVGKRPYGHSALKTAAACVKGFYLYQAMQGVNGAVAEELRVRRLPTRADRHRAMIGHVLTGMPANPLAPDRPVRRHPKMLPTGAREQLAGRASGTRDAMVVTWLADGGFRIGELCGLHLVDLHLRRDAACGECRTAHVHICHRETNPNRARVKSKYPWEQRDGTVSGGIIRRASPAMIHSYFAYLTTQYPRDARHGMLLVSLQGPTRGRPWTTDAARGMLRRAGHRLELGMITPHAFRHSFATGVLDAAGGNTVIARDAGGWASAATVEQVYGHADVHDPVFAAALERVWSQQP